MALIYMSLMIRDVEYILMHLLAICIDYLDIHPFQILCLLKKNKFFGLL